MFIYRLESDWKGGWTQFFHLPKLETLQGRAHELTQVMPGKHGESKCSLSMHEKHCALVKPVNPLLLVGNHLTWSSFSIFLVEPGYYRSFSKEGGILVIFLDRFFGFVPKNFGLSVYCSLQISVFWHLVFGFRQKYWWVFGFDFRGSYGFSYLGSSSSSIWAAIFCLHGSHIAANLIFAPSVICIGSIRISITGVWKIGFDGFGCGFRLLANFCFGFAALNVFFFRFCCLIDPDAPPPPSFLVRQSLT